MNESINPLYLLQNSTFINIGIILSIITQITSMFYVIICYSKSLLYLFNYREFYIKNSENKNKILNEIRFFYCFSYTDNFEPIGMIIDREHWIPQYFIYGISEDKYDECNVRIFCKEQTLKKLLQNHTEKQIERITLNNQHIPVKVNNNNPSSETTTTAQLKKKYFESFTYDNSSDDESDYENENCTLYDETNKEIQSFAYISGSKTYGFYNSSVRKICLSNVGPIEFLGYQQEAFKEIMHFYKENHFCKTFIYGPPGKGKTYFSYILANMLQCFMTDTYSPTDPGAGFSLLYNRYKSTLTKPLIVVLDEVDILLENIHHNKLEFHKNFKREIYDKTSWNSFIDKIEFGLFPNVILILTSNKTKEEIDMLDKSYLREGRMNLYFNWK